MKKNTEIQYVVIDSGLGGLPYLNSLRKKAPTASSIYIADTANFPYGTKTKETLVSLSLSLVKKVILRFNPTLIILACNTISVSTLSELRNHFTIPFVGTVPAIKLASTYTKNGKIGVIASKKTIHDPYTKDLITKFGVNYDFFLLSEQDLIQKIEKGLLFSTEQQQLNALQPTINFCTTNKIDTLVLSCTHYLIIEDLFKKYLEPTTKIIESLDGVINQAIRLSPPQKDNNLQSSFFVTSKLSNTERQKYIKFAELFNLNFEGKL